MFSKLVAHIILVATTASWLVSALPSNKTDDQVNAAIDAGTFQDPSSNSKPRYRYWIPDASIDLNRVSQDIADLAAIGAGGVEVLGYYLYGGTPGSTIPVDWTKYGWGTPAWKTLFDTFIAAHKEHGLVMDFAMGPNQGQGVPADPDDDGLMWDLFPYNVSVPIGGSFSGQIPGWGADGTLHAVLTALVTKSEMASSPEPSLPNSQLFNRTQITISADSVQDVTNRVTENGTLDITFPSNETGLEYQIFAIYLVREHDRNQAYAPGLAGSQNMPQDIAANGSWIVDHFSSQGAKVMTDFWEQYILINGTREALLEVGNYAWEDSVEIYPVVYWTRTLPERFQQNHGYEITKWLPILFHQNSRVEWNAARGHYSHDPWYITDEPDAGNQKIADYRTTLAEMYGDYLRALNTWTNDYLGVQFSSQISYNMAMDMQTNIPLVNAPELESLGFFHDIDQYRQYAGPSNLAGKRIISTECGANPNEVFQQTLPELLWDVKRSIVGSVNNFIFHGFPFSGNYPNTTWPVYTTFPYRFSEMHGRHQPAWDFYSDSMYYTARLQYIFQAGVPKRDLAFYEKFTTFPRISRNYQPVDLEQAGWTYEYINPDNMYLPAAVVSNNILAPDRQAFQALIIRGNDSMTVPGVQKIVQYAQEGLPILIAGGIPSSFVSFNTSGEAYVNEALSSIQNFDNVHMLPDEELSGAVESLGITPLTRISADRTWYTYWRTDEEANKDYVFVYNDAQGIPINTGYSEGTVEFKSTGVPYLYDTWTGAQTRLLNYTQTDSTTTIFFGLAGNQSTVVAFHNDETPQGQHVLSHTPGVLSLHQDEDNTTLIAHVGPGSGKASFSTSDGRTYDLASTSAQTTTLADWTLIVEHWDPPDDMEDLETVAVKTNTTHHLSSLTSWRNIPDASLHNVSGRGYYSTNFTWSPGPDVTGAVIDFGAVFHSLRVSINGQTLAPLDVAWAKADIGNYLVAGENTVEAVVATTLANRLIPIWYDIETSGIHAGNGSAPAEQDYGLLFDVTITPYNTVRLV